MKSFKRFVQEEIALPNRKFVKIPTNVLGQNNDITKDIFDMIDKTYKNIGGYPDFKKSTDLPDNHRTGMPLMWTKTRMQILPRSERARQETSN